MLSVENLKKSKFTRFGTVFSGSEWLNFDVAFQRLILGVEMRIFSPSIALENLKNDSTSPKLLGLLRPQEMQCKVQPLICFGEFLSELKISILRPDAAAATRKIYRNVKPVN